MFEDQLGGSPVAGVPRARCEYKLLVVREADARRISFRGGVSE
jgi:hypothetical protein